MKERTVERIPHRELRNNSAEILRRVAEGETFEITNHGEVVGVLTPAPRRIGGLEVAREASRRGGWSELPKVKLSRPSGEILDELREDRV